jgi:hypothetical protein
MNEYTLGYRMRAYLDDPLGVQIQTDVAIQYKCYTSKRKASPRYMESRPKDKYPEVPNQSVGLHTTKLCPARRIPCNQALEY